MVRSDHALSPLIQVSEDMLISPSEDLKSYRDLIKRMAAILWLEISQPAPNVTDNIYDIVQRDTSSAITLLIPGILLQHTKEP